MRCAQGNGSERGWEEELTRIQNMYTPGLMGGGGGCC